MGEVILCIPSSIVQISDNQKVVIDGVREKLDEFTFNNLDDLKENINNIIEKLKNTEELIRLRSNIAKFSSGLGMSKVLHKVFEVNSFTLKGVTSSVYEYIYFLQTQQGTRKYSRNKFFSSLDEHLKWCVDKYEKSNDYFGYILTAQDVNLGHLRINPSRDFPGKYEVSIIISEAFQGEGLSSLALNLLREKHSDKELVAHIERENIASVKAFKRASFEYMKDNYYIANRRLR